MNARHFGRFVLLPAVLLAARAAAAPAPVALDWSAPAGCPDRAAVLAEVERLVATPEPSPLTARGAIAQDGKLWRLHLELDSREGPGSRDFQDDSCLRLAQVAALAITLALESTPAPPAPKVEEKKPAPPPPPPRAPPRFLVRALLGGDLGSLRAPSPGPGLVAGVFLGRARIELGANYWFPQTVDGLEYQLISGGVHACTAITDAPEIGVCAGLDAGRMQGRWTATDVTVVHAWMALAGGAAVGFALTDWLALRLELGVGLTLVAPTFDAASDSSRGPAPVFGRALLGVETHF